MQRKANSLEPSGNKREKPLDRDRGSVTSPVRAQAKLWRQADVGKGHLDRTPIYLGSHSLNKAQGPGKGWGMEAAKPSLETQGILGVL